MAPIRREPSSPEIQPLIERHLSGRGIVSVTPVAGGDLNESMLVRTITGETFVARRPRNPSPWLPDVAGQVAAIRCAAACGVPVPEVVASDPEGMIYRFITGHSLGPGLPLGGPAEPAPGDPELARAAGRLYGCLHTRRGEGFGAMQADGSDPDWSVDAYFELVVQQAKRMLTRDTIAVGVAPADLERAAALFEAAPRSVRSRFVHGDASPANTIVANGDVVAVIDFDAAAWNDPAVDLAWWWYHSPDTADQFAAGCAEVSKPTDDRTTWFYRVRLLIGLVEVVAERSSEQSMRLGRLLAQAVTACS